MSKQRYAWLARDAWAHKADENFYALFTKRPRLDCFGGLYMGACLETFCVKRFHKFSSLRLKPGQCIRVALPIEFAAAGEIENIPTEGTP